MNRLKHLWPQITSFENVAQAAREAMRGKRATRAGARFFARWESEVACLSRELQEKSYRPGPYTYFLINDPKERTIAAAPFRDRVVHHALIRVIEPLIDPRFIEDSFACRKGKGTHAGVRRALEFSRKFPWAVKCDIRRYFPSIDHEIMRAQLSRLIADPDVINLINVILSSHVGSSETRWPEEGNLLQVNQHPKGLPIGNLTSQFFANIHLNGLDHFVKQTLRAQGYVRYVDDFLIFGASREEVRERGEASSEYLRKLFLEIHPDKYRVLRSSKGIDFCGFVMRSDGRVRIRSAGVRRFQRRYSLMQREVKCGKIAASKMTLSVRSWIAHAEHAQSWSLRRDVLSGKPELGVF